MALSVMVAGSVSIAVSGSDSRCSEAASLLFSEAVPTLCATVGESVVDSDTCRSREDAVRAGALPLPASAASFSRRGASIVSNMLSMSSRPFGALLLRAPLRSAKMSSTSARSVLPLGASRVRPLKALSISSYRETACSPSSHARERASGSAPSLRPYFTYAMVATAVARDAAAAGGGRRRGCFRTQNRREGNRPALLFCDRVAGKRFSSVFSGLILGHSMRNRCVFPGFSRPTRLEGYLGHSGLGVPGRAGRCGTPALRNGPDPKIRAPTPQHFRSRGGSAQQPGLLRRPLPRCGTAAAFPADASSVAHGK